MPVGEAPEDAASALDRQPVASLLREVFAPGQPSRASAAILEVCQPAEEEDRARSGLRGAQFSF